MVIFENYTLGLIFNLLEQANDKDEWIELLITTIPPKPYALEVFNNNIKKCMLIICPSFSFFLCGG